MDIIISLGHFFPTSNDILCIKSKIISFFYHLAGSYNACFEMQEICHSLDRGNNLENIFLLTSTQTANLMLFFSFTS